MTYTEKRTEEEFDEEFPLFKSEEAMVFASRRRIKAFIATKITQAKAEERVRELIKSSKDPYMLPATEERFLKDLSSLDKPLTDNKE